jgi:flagellar hook assembly protein FlgD
VLKYVLAQRGPVRLDVYASDGRLVRVLTHGIQPAGRNEVAWDGADERGRAVANGIYVVRLNTGSTGTSRKVVLERP